MTDWYDIIYPTDWIEKFFDKMAFKKNKEKKTTQAILCLALVFVSLSNFTTAKPTIASITDNSTPEKRYVISTITEDDILDFDIYQLDNTTFSIRTTAKKEVPIGYTWDFNICTDAQETYLSTEISQVLTDKQKKLLSEPASRTKCTDIYPIGEKLIDGNTKLPNGEYKFKIDQKIDSFLIHAGKDSYISLVKSTDAGTQFYSESFLKTSYL